MLRSKNNHQSPSRARACVCVRVCACARVYGERSSEHRALKAFRHAYVRAHTPEHSSNVLCMILRNRPPHWESKDIIHTEGYWDDFIKWRAIMFPDRHCEEVPRFHQQSSLRKRNQRTCMNRFYQDQILWRSFYQNQISFMDRFHWLTARIGGYTPTSFSPYKARWARPFFCVEGPYVWRSATRWQTQTSVDRIKCSCRIIFWFLVRPKKGASWSINHRHTCLDCKLREVTQIEGLPFDTTDRTDRSKANQRCGSNHIKQTFQACTEKCTVRKVS